MKQKVKIRLKEWHYQCGDGCCDTWGTTTTVNDEELDCNNSDVYTILQQVLTKLGYEVDIEEEYPDYD